MAIHRDTQGPCPNGFHVGTKDEWQKIYDILTVTFGLSQTYATPRTYLKMPTPTALSSTTGAVISASKTSGYYWTSTTMSGNDARVYVVSFTSSEFTITDYAKSNGMSIRPVADTAVIPDSSRTVLYDGSEYATGMSVYDPGVYYNSTLGLISLSDDGVDWISIADKNVGATAVYSGTTSEATSGGFFQRGNNHMFPYAGATSSTSGTKVDASEYGPGKYYDRGVFITISSSSSALDWTEPSNNNLWGGVTNGTWEDPLLFTHHGHIGTWHAIGHKDTQGPCPEGFHIPTMEEVNTLSNILGIDWSRTTKPDIADYLHIPAIGYIDKDGNVPSQREYSAFIWTCNATGTKARGGFLYALSSVDRASMMPIRPFKDEPVVPDNSWTVEYQPEGATGGDTIGVYHSSTLGLISISKDGETWITIADKNLGATQVFADDYATPTAANVGNLYQRGNNYGIPYGTTPTISQTQVDASGYGPTQPYSSSTIIRGNSDWSSVKNDNLWGGVTNGMRYEVK